MIDLKIINKEIEKLEKQNLNYSICDKLATLYIIQEHLLKQQNNSSIKVENK